MFESVVAVPAHFTVEFLGFLVFAAGAVLAFSRSDLVPGEPSNRITVAAGFAGLAGAQVLHGGSFANAVTDDARILIALEAVGLAFVVIGLVGSLKAATVAPAVWTLKEPLLLAPAGASLVLFFAALAGSRSPETKALRRLALFALLFTVAHVLTAGAPPESEVGTRTVSGLVYAAHGIKLLAFGALGSWIWSVVRSSIRTRFVASFAVLLMAVVLALSTALTGVISNSVEDEELRQLGAQVDSVIDDITQDSAGDLKDDVSTITQDQGVRQRIASDNGVRGLANSIRSTPTFELQFGFVMVMDARGAVLDFSGRGPHRDRGRKRPKPSALQEIDVVTINGSQVIGDIAGGSEVAVSVDHVGRDLVAIVAGHEVTDPNQPNRRIGIVAIGTWVDALRIEGISSRLGSKASMIVHGKTVASDLPGKVPARGLVPSGLRSQVQGCPNRPVTGQIAVGDLAYFSAIACLRNQADDQVATIVLSSPARNVVEARGLFTRILFLIAMGVGAVSLVLAWFSGRAITQPIQDLTEAAGAVREGNLKVVARVHGEDEVGQLGETFNEMTASLFRMTNDLRDAARQEHDLRARIETIIESMADGLVAVDEELNVLAFNQAAEQITGVRSDSAVGRPVREVLDARDGQGESVALPIFDLVRGSVDGVYLKRGGDLVPVAVVSAVLPGVEGGISGAVAVLRDMTREREVERMKTEFLSNISHELRTPLTPIKGYAEILGHKDIPPDKAKKFALGILESTGRLERIVQLLVDFSAMEAGRLAPKTTSVDIGSIVSSLATEWASRSSRHSVEVDVASALPLVVGDERLLRRSLEEVLDNAVKFSPSGGTIKLRATGTDAGNGHRGEVQISISDEGIGIMPEDMSKIFSDFQQLDGSETRSYGGLGLGLAFVQRIIEAHEGSIDVESEPNEGTRLTITIPASRAPVKT
jgi:PAS domain S-box-containing protein